MLCIPPGIDPRLRTIKNSGMKILLCHRVVPCLVIPVWILAICVWGGAAADAQTAGDNAQAAPEFQSLFDGQSLTGWKIADFGGQEDITVQDGVIQAAMGYPLAGIVYDGDELPVDDYILELSACKREGKYVGICGQAPSDYPEITEWLVEHAIESISLNPDSVIRMTQVVLDIENQSQ